MKDSRFLKYIEKHWCPDEAGFLLEECVLENNMRKTIKECEKVCDKCWEISSEKSMQKAKENLIL